MYSYILAPKAQSEFEKSVEYYTGKSEEATLNFIDLIEKTLGSICKSPYLGRNRHINFYERILVKYPFTVVYAVESDVKLIVIISIYHHKRNPKHKYKKK